MGGKIYNDRGQVIGTYESKAEQDAREEGLCCMMVATPILVILIGPIVLAAIVVFGPWALFGPIAIGNNYYGAALFLATIIIIARFIMKQENGMPGKKPFWTWLRTELLCSIRLTVILLLITGVYLWYTEFQYSLEYVLNLRYSHLGNEANEILGMILLINAGIGFGCPIIPTIYTTYRIHKKGARNSSATTTSDNTTLFSSKRRKKLPKTGTTATSGICPRCGGLTNNGICPYCGRN